MASDTATSETPVVIVIGATGGIGSELSCRLSAKRFRLVLAARSADAVKDLADTLNAFPEPLDAATPSEVDGCFDRTLDREGRIDGVVNAAGSLLLKPAHLTSDDEWHATLAANLHSAFNVVRAAGRVMGRSGGSVVLMSSAAARTGMANHEAIAAAKAGVTGLALSAAASYASRNLRFNVVAPGLVRTPMTRKLTSNDMMARASSEMHALGRIGEPSDVASLIAWLLDPANGWVTGQVFGVDGGLATVRPRATSRGGAGK